MLRTRITELLGIDYPVMSSAMAMHTGATLAAAVSNAGGLGGFGAIHATKGPDWVADEIQNIRDATDKPFAVGFITSFIPQFEQAFEATLAAKPPVITLSFGSPQPWLDRAKASGAKVICQVQEIQHAREAVESGADVIAAQGTEAGGHTGTMTLLPLLVSCIEAFPDTPVMAAGGISTGRALAAVLAAGADGALVGTAFLATPECHEIPEEHKQLIVDSDGEDTVLTRVYDLLWGMPWPEGIFERGRRNKITDEWDRREDEIPANRERIAAEVQAAEHDFDPAARDVIYGQSAGGVSAIRPAAEVLHQICNDAERILRERQSLLA